MTEVSACLAGYPRFRKHLHVDLGPGEVFLLDEHGVTALRGAGVVALAPLLDGSRSVTSLVGAPPQGLTPDAALRLIDRLVHSGTVVVDGAPALGTRPDEAWWGSNGAGPGTPRLGAATLRAVGCDPTSVAVALASANVPVVGLDEAVDPDVVLYSDHVDPRLADVDDVERRRGRPWLLANLHGATLWLCPALVPGATACWHCLAHRLAERRRPEAAARAALGLLVPAPWVPSGLSAGTAARLVALKTVKCLAGHRSPQQHGIWALDTRDLRGQHHLLRARPQCPTCGDPRLVAAQLEGPVQIQPAPRAVPGADRTRSPQEILECYRHFVGPVTGVVARLVPERSAPPFRHVGPGPVDVHEGWLERPWPRCGRALQSDNGDKGLTAIDAEGGALCEAVERYSGTRQGDEAVHRGSLRSLGADAVDPRACLRLDERQYARREERNRPHLVFNRVPAPFDPEADVDWTPLWSLTASRHRLLPTAMRYFGAPSEASVSAGCNGCATGSSLEDAVLQGLLELVERDAAGSRWYGRIRALGIDLAAFADLRITEQRTHQAAIDRELWALDVGVDLGIPVIGAFSRLKDAPAAVGERILMGFGAHPDPAVALRRAVAEVNQMLVADQFDPDTVSDADLPYAARPDVRDEVEALLGTLHRAGLGVLVLDQTRPDAELPVVRVVVPGLRMFWPRFGPGRLYDVPVALGRLAAPTPFDDLNSEPMFC